MNYHENVNVSEFVEECYGFEKTIYTVNFEKIEREIIKRCENFPTDILDSISDVLYELDENQVIEKEG